jgi:SdpC family antimicrobial peptide
MRYSRLGPATAVLLLFSCTAAKQQPAERFDGKTLFRCFYFGSGPVATRFPELDLLTPETTPENKATEDRLMGKIESKDALFYARFEQHLYSRNHVRISRALEEGSEILAEVIGEELGVTPETVRTTDQLARLDLGLVRVKILMEVEAIAHYQYLAVARHIWFWNPGPPNRQSRLARDRFIDLVTRQLGS